MHPFEIVDRYFRVNVFSLGGVLSSVAYKCRLHIPYRLLSRGSFMGL